MSLTTQKSVKYCPKCGSITQVRDSRSRKDRKMKYVRLVRRRYCYKCEYIYSTVEMPESEYKDLVRVRNLLLKTAKELSDES